MNEIDSVCHPSAGCNFTEKQGQCLAFIYAYTRVNGRPPAQPDMQRYFRVTPPTVHQMVLTWNAPVSSDGSLVWRAVSKC
jgi:hypothetical protein